MQSLQQNKSFMMQSINNIGKMYRQKQRPTGSVVKTQAINLELIHSNMRAMNLTTYPRLMETKLGIVFFPLFSRCQKNSTIDLKNTTSKSKIQYHFTQKEKLNIRFLLTTDRTTLTVSAMTIQQNHTSLQIKKCKYFNYLKRNTEQKTEHSMGNYHL